MKDQGNYSTVSLTSVPSQIVEQDLLETILKNVENEEVIDDNQHGSTNWKSLLSNLMAFCDGDKAMVDNGRAIDVIYLDFCKAQAFDTVLHDTFVSKL